MKRLRLLFVEGKITPKQGNGVKLKLPPDPAHIREKPIVTQALHSKGWYG